MVFTALTALTAFTAFTALTALTAFTAFNAFAAFAAFPILWPNARPIIALSIAANATVVLAARIGAVIALKAATFDALIYFGMNGWHEV